MATMSEDELVPDCVTCRQHFEDNGQLLTAAAQRRRLNALHSNPRDEVVSVATIVARHMRSFHEEHQHRAN